MHELSIAQNIIEIVTEQLPSGENHLLRSVKLLVGEQAGVVPDSLEFCFRALVEGTDFAGTTLEIERVPFVVECRRCGERSTNEAGVMMCARCGINDVTLVSGNELLISSIVIAEGAPV